MAIKTQNNIGLSPSEELLAQLDSNQETPQDGVIRKTKKSLANLTTGVSTLALAGTLLGTPAMAEYKPAYEQLASNEVMLVEKMTPERMFSLAKFNDEKIAGFQTLTSRQKQNILKYFAEGYNPNLTIKEIKKLANNLYYFYADKNEKMKRINNPNLENIRNGISLEATGKSIEDVLTTYGTQFSNEGREIDKLRIQMLDENTRQNKELNLILDKLLNK